ncbi:MAG TPA: hypothetical protein VFQ91_21330 [Bryobacteraceae bacterium]|nr:hypothetical protein [Bryobacteraceae bacterium]
MWKRQALIVIAFVLALRLPFLSQPIQGDDIYYLYGAEHAQIEPLHPKHTSYAFQGDLVSMQGHPHPPFNTWYLGLLLAGVKEVREIPFHAAYIPFSLIAALSALSIARRYTEKPLLAALLFCVVPSFIINGTSLESDLPLLAFWLLSIALFLASRMALSAIAMLLAAACGYQAAVLVPILFLLRRKPHWVMATIPVALAAYELWERAAYGAMPAQVLTGYFSTYGLQRLENKLRNAAALTAHLAWLVTPFVSFLLFRREWVWAIIPAAAAAYIDPNPLCWASVFVGVLILAGSRRQGWLGLWVLLFFGAAVVGAFAGSARYLLPLALPLCIIASEHTGYWAIAPNLVLGLLLAMANYQHWDGYRRLAAAAPEDRRVWVNGEWGLRFYLESAGALPLLRGQAVQPGDYVITSELADPISFTTGGGIPAPVDQTIVTSPIPLRLIGLHSRSGYSTAAKGFRPFDVSNAPIDIVRTISVVESRPALSYLHMGSPDATSQIVSGVYQLEDQQWRWMDGRAVLLLKRPVEPASVEVKIYLPDPAPGRTIQIGVDGQTVLRQELARPGAHTLRTPVIAAREGDAQVTITIDKTFQAPNDNRRLGLILAAAGFTATSP